MPPPPKKDEPFEFRLQRYYAAIDLSGVLVPLFSAAVIGFFPGLWPWVEYLPTTVLLFSVMGIFNAANLLLYRTYRKRIFFHLNRYSFVLFFMYFILVSGGVYSRYIFLLLFPVMVSAVDLDPRMTRRIGIIVSSFFALLVILNQAASFSPVMMNDLLFNLGLLMILCWYMYIIVRETLRQKYERDEASRKFTRLIEVENLKNDFLSIAQHQLRTPLSGIRFALESLQGDASVSPEARELIGSGISRVGDALKIVNVMLMTAETGVKDLALEKAPLDLAEMVRSLIDDLNYVARQKGIAVTLSIPPSLTISADEKRLKPAIANLVDNAFKYSPNGKVSISLSMNDRKQAILEVRDNGIGISPEDMQFVFSRMYRGRNAIALEPDQSGVGLYTAKHIIELHGGTVKLESELGKGTAITVTLPK